jgi:hypothetical protein
VYVELEALKGSLKLQMFENRWMRKEMVVKMVVGETGWAWRSV